MQNLTLLVTAIVAMSLTACSTNPALPNAKLDNNQQAPILIAKDLGLKQCEPVTGDVLAISKNQLAQQQIKIINAYCAADGLMRTQVCGASTGKLGIFKIPARQFDQAQSLGFKAVGEAQYQTVACN